MFKRLLIAATAAAALISTALIATPASAKDGLYASGNTGIGFVPNYPNTVPFGVAVGYEFNKFVRTELALDMFTMGQNGASLGSVTTFTAMPKVYLQYPVGKWVPYVDGGLGLASLSGATTWNTAMSWTVGAGVMYQMTDNFALGAGYDYVATATPTIAGLGGSAAQWQSNVIKVTGRFNF